VSIDCGTSFSVTDDSQIAVFESSSWAERGFCRKCGSHLYYRIKEANQYEVPVGLFDELEDFELKCQVFIDAKPLFYSFANETSDMTAAEVFAKYAPT